MRESDPGALLDLILSDDSLDEETLSAHIDTLIGRFSPGSLASAISSRLDDLEGHRGELLIALVEALAREDLWDALAEAVTNQPKLSPDMAFIALEALEGTGRIEASHSLTERREELDELLDEGTDLSLLAEQIEEDETTLPMAIEALSRIEPEIRVAIIDQMANEQPSRGVHLLLERLASEEDPATRSAAASVLAKLRGAADSRQELDTLGRGPKILASAVGPIDGDGVGEVAFLLESGPLRTIVGFSCDVSSGIGEVHLSEKLLPDQASELFEEYASRMGDEVTREVHEAALALVSGSAWLNREALDSRTQTSLTAIFGHEFHPHPVFADLGEDSEGIHSELCTAEDVRLIFNRRPEWIDRSELTDSLALEMVLHDGERAPDPALDPGPFRVLLEGRILGQIELYRRMLLWTALAWTRSRSAESHAAKRLAVEMSDPQNAVPGHPFLEELMVRSLTEAKTRIQAQVTRRRAFGSLSTDLDIGL